MAFGACRCTDHFWRSTELRAFSVRWFIRRHLFHYESDAAKEPGWLTEGGNSRPLPAIVAAFGTNLALTPSQR